MKTTLRLLVCAAAIWVTPADGLAQPEPKQGNRPRQSDGAERPGQGKNFRAQLQKRADDSRARLTAIEEAIRRLDAGEDSAKVREWFESTSPGGRRMVGSRPFLPEKVGSEDARPPSDAMAAPLTPEERERALRFLEEHLPRVAEKMRSLAESNPTTLDRLLMRMRPKLLDLGNAARYDQELFELKVKELQAAMQVMESARALREAADADADRTELRRSLREAVADHFDIQLKVSERESARLAERIDTLREEINDRKTRRDDFIDREVEATMKGPHRQKDGRPPDGRPPNDQERRREPK